VWPSVKLVRGYDEIRATIAGFVRLCRKRRNVEGITGAFKMWVFVLLLNLLGRKNFMRFLGPADATSACEPYGRERSRALTSALDCC
jgi:hypothetical protein